jgi:amidase
VTVATITDLWRMSAMDLAKAIRSRQASSQEVIQAHLRRIEAVNPTINAVTVVLGEQAVEAAKAADRAVAAGGDLPPLHGVPITIKETIDLAGTPTTLGVEALAGAYPDVDAPQVERVRAAGAIPIGRTNCPDFGIRWHTDSELWGATVNPWDRSRTPGGSSGGEAAALATGMTPLGLGNDLGGSLRWPAQCCGVSSLKPTLGRIPHATTIEPMDAPISTQLMLVEGVMARREADLRTAFAVMAGASWRDPWSVPAPLRGPEPAKPVRVAIVVDPAGHGTSDQVQAGVRKAARALDDAGYVVEEVEPPSIDAAARIWLDLLGADFRPVLQTMSFPWGADTDRFVSALFGLSSEPNPLTTIQNLIARQSLLRAWGEFQERYPLIVAPIFTDVPFQVGADLSTAGVAEIVRGMRMAVAVNALGLPAVALPVGTGDGLPRAVQVIGRRYREDLCLDAAAALEGRLGTITPIDPSRL